MSIARCTSVDGYSDDNVVTVEDGAGLPRSLFVGFTCIAHDYLNIFNGLDGKWRCWRSFETLGRHDVSSRVLGDKSTAHAFVALKWGTESESTIQQDTCNVCHNRAGRLCTLV